MLGGAHLGDRVVDDLLDSSSESGSGMNSSRIASSRSSVAACSSRPAGAERIRRLDPLLALALQDLQLSSSGKRSLKLLLRALQRVDDQPERVASLGIARLSSLP